jgi:Ca-activated chloride channel family protein
MAAMLAGCSIAEGTTFADTEATGRTGAARAESTLPPPNLKVTSRPGPAAPPYTALDDILYVAYRATENGQAGEEIDRGFDGEEPGAWLSVPPGRYVVVAVKDLARAEARVAVAEGRRTVVDLMLPAGTIEARAMASTGRPIADADVEWEVVDAHGRRDREVGPTLSLAVGAGEAQLTARLGGASSTVRTEVTTGATQAFDVVLGVGTLRLSGKRSADADEHDEGIRWDVTDAAGHVTTGYGRAELHLPAGDYSVKATLGSVETFANISLDAGETIAKEYVVPTGRVIARALFAENGPPVTANLRLDILKPEPGADGRREVVATSFRDGETFDLPPGDYALAATADLSTGEAPVRLQAGASIEVSVVLNAGVLALQSAGGKQLEIRSDKMDIYGDYPLLAKRYEERATLALPAGQYRASATFDDGSQRTVPIAIAAGQRTAVTIP